MDPRRRILGELGLLAPEVETLRALSAEDLRRVIHARGRRLLARYHPDRNPGDAEAVGLFRVACQVIREAEAFEQAPRAVVVSMYPRNSSEAACLYPRRSVRQEYSTQVETSNGRRYDARRVVLIRL